MDTRFALLRALALASLLALLAGCTNGRRGGTALPRDAGAASDAGGWLPGEDAGVPLPGTDAGTRPPGVDAGGPLPGIDAGVVGMCSDLSGSYSLTGDCVVTACTVTQTGCDVTATCDGPIGTLVGTISGTSAMLTSPAGICLVDIVASTGVFSGTCVAGSSVCSFDATPI